MKDSQTTVMQIRGGWYLNVDMRKIPLTEDLLICLLLSNPVVKSVLNTCRTKLLYATSQFEQEQPIRLMFVLTCSKSWIGHLSPDRRPFRRPFFVPSGYYPRPDPTRYRPCDLPPLKGNLSKADDSGTMGRYYLKRLA